MDIDEAIRIITGPRPQSDREEKTYEQAVSLVVSTLQKITRLEAAVETLSRTKADRTCV